MEQVSFGKLVKIFRGMGMSESMAEQAALGRDGHAEGRNFYQSLKESFMGMGMSVTLAEQAALGKDGPIGVPLSEGYRGVFEVRPGNPLPSKGNEKPGDSNRILVKGKSQETVYVELTERDYPFFALEKIGGCR